MTKNKANQIIENVLGSLIRSVEQGHSDTLRAYLDAMAHFHKYSLSNIMLIAMQRPLATHVAGYHTWKKLGRFVIKGEKGIAILAPMISKKDCSDRSGDSVDDVFGFKVVYVFDVAQTGGRELPILSSVKGDPRLISNKLNDLMAHLGISLKYSSSLDYDGISRGGKIEIRTGLPQAHDFAVRVHELAHEMLHKNNRSSLSRKQKETEAEAVAHVVCQAMGLDTNSASADYIHLYQGNKDNLMDSFAKIKDASTRIIAGLQ
ncbi:MAG: ArdC family protein [Proteobacteria bacterium]|nr:ArdC family protein [Pseudomonadota bacterium]